MNFVPLPFILFPARCDPPRMRLELFQDQPVGSEVTKGFVMKKIAVALATIATVAVMSAPAAEARGGRNAAIGFGIAAGALVAGAAAANSYNYYGGPAYYGEPAYGYGGPVYAEPVYGPGYYRSRSYHRNHSNDPNPVDMNPYNPW